MKKFALLLLTASMLITITSCTNNEISSNQGNNIPSGGISQGQGNRAPGTGQQADSAYNLDDLIERVKQAGCISGEPKSLHVKDIGAEKGIAYGNVVFLQYDLDSSKAYFDAYEANQVTINGKTVEIGAINGPYFMVFLDGKIDQNAVKAFYSLGFGS